MGLKTRPILKGLNGKKKSGPLLKGLCFISPQNTPILMAIDKGLLIVPINYSSFSKIVQKFLRS